MAYTVKTSEKHPGVYPGHRVYGEQLVKVKGVEYRIWNPYRSKLAAAILKGLSQSPIKSGEKVLYLGAATGTTASHVGDIVGRSGRVYCVEFSHRVMRELINVCNVRKNLIPILADARKPSFYKAIVPKVDGIYCDVAQPDQARILADNADVFLKPGGWILIAIKARSIDVKRPSEEIIEEQISDMKQRGIKVLETHPRSALKNTGLNSVKDALSKYINLGDIVLEKLSKDTLDAIVCAAVGWAYVNRDVEVVAASDGKIFLLKKVSY